MKWTILLLLLAPLVTPQITDAPQTIDLSQPYLSLPSCAQLCFWQPYPGNYRSDAIASYLSCTQPSVYSGALESCFCRPDYSSDVVNYISSCVSVKCQDSPGDWRVDVSKATSVYGGYCGSVNGRGTGVGSTVVETDAVSALTENQSPTTIESAKTSLVESIPANTSPSLPSTTTTSTSTTSVPTNTTSPEAYTKDGGLPTGTIAGIAVGVVAGVVLVLLVVVFSSKRIRTKFSSKLPSLKKKTPKPQGRVSVGVYTADGLPVKDGVVYGDGRAETEYLPTIREV
ncbi:hypothetical protein TWF481_006750 [Arthrobotrys musiformis]|uniref:Extracellular membrane protein CFEM domain-containing protein n=1 Tax=Arthrobotrys musiformis TaxID=47236 RepID=A0AAV9WF70_9PEZI